MKRFSQSLTAVAMAGALALGGATVAQAQIPAPAEITVDGVVYQKQADGNYKSNPEFGSPVTLTAEQAQAAWEKQQENEGEDTEDEGNEDTPGDNTEGEDNQEETPGIKTTASRLRRPRRTGSATPATSTCRIRPCT